MSDLSSSSFDMSPLGNSKSDLAQSTDESRHWQKLFISVSSSMSLTVNELNLVRGELTEKENRIQALKVKYENEITDLKQKYEEKIRDLEGKNQKYLQYDLALTKRDFTFDDCLNNKSYGFEFLKNCCEEVIKDFDLVVDVPNTHPEYDSKLLKSKRNRISAATSALWAAGFQKQSFSDAEWQGMISKVRKRIKQMMATSKYYSIHGDEVKRKRQQSRRQDQSVPKKRCANNDINNIESSDPSSSGLTDNSFSDSDNIPTNNLSLPALSSTFLELPLPQNHADDYDPTQPITIEGIQIGNFVAIAQEPSRGIGYGKVLRVRTVNNDVLIQQYEEDHEGKLRIIAKDDSWERLSFLIHSDVRLLDGCIEGKDIINLRYEKFKKQWFTKKSLSQADIDKLIF